VEEGTHDDLVGRGGAYAEMWALQCGERRSAVTAGPRDVDDDGRPEGEAAITYR
jgi:hypothetical protein